MADIVIIDRELCARIQSLYESLGQKPHVLESFIDHSMIDLVREYIGCCTVSPESLSAYLPDELSDAFFSNIITGYLGDMMCSHPLKSRSDICYPKVLFDCCEASNLKKVAEALYVGATIEMREGGGITPVLCAVGRNSQQVVELLLAHKADTERCCDVARFTALHLAVATGRELMVKLLLASNANINARDCTGDTPLDYAKRRDNKRIMALLQGEEPPCAEEMPCEEVLQSNRTCVLL